MIRSIQLQNFKAFGERVSIELAPITLIFGENSAGKSSILQSLNLLKQTRESREAGALILPRAEQGIVDLGSFQEMIFDHELSRSLSIRCEVGPGGSWSNQYLRNWLGSVGADGVSMEITFNRPSLEEEVLLKDLRFFLGREDPIAIFKPADVSNDQLRELLPYVQRDRRILFPKLRAAQCKWFTEKDNYWKSTFEEFSKFKGELNTYLQNQLTSLRKRGTSHDILSLWEVNERENALDRQKFEGVFSEAQAFYSGGFSLAGFVNRMCLRQQDTLLGLDGFIPIGGTRFGKELFIEDDFFRAIPQRFRPYELTLDLSRLAVLIGREFERHLESLFPLGPFRRPPERWYIFTGSSPQDVGYRGELLPDLMFRRPELVKETNFWLDRLEIGYEIRVKPVGGSVSDLFEVRLVDRRRTRNVEVGLSDVGFGISQILPFVVQSLAAEGQIISIEQPEVHVHPRLQADLGDLLAEAIQEPRRNQFIVETHSEHLVLRIQKLIRLGKLFPKDVSIIYVSRGEDGAIVNHLRLDQNGSFIDEWPDGFFPERLRELK